MTVRSDWWRGLATAALTRFSATDAGTGTTFGYSMAAGASGILHGWSAPGTVVLLNRLKATRYPAGGYGLAVPFDAFGDGTFNPVPTTYAVSVAGHAGTTLLAAYRNSSTAVAKADVQGCITAVMAMPRLTVARGQCIAYSDNTYDDDDPATMQVHNVNAGVAAFLADCNFFGLGATGMQAFITDISLHSVIGYSETLNGWPYISGQSELKDADHDSYTAESVYGRTGGPLAYWIGREAVYRLMTTDFSSQNQGPIAHTRLASLNGGPGSWSKVYPGTSLWSEYAYTRWKSEQEDYGEGLTGDRAAQFAFYAAQAMAHVD